jgi:homoprotocatechuate degradation regulator HpaR
MPSFRRSLPMLLLWAREAVMQRFRPELNARGITDQQWRIIRALVEVNACEIFELSACCCIHPASLSRILPKLAEEGIISRSHNAKDQRRVVVSLTAEGRRLFENGIVASNRIYAQLASDIGAHRIEHVTAVLECLIASLEPERIDRSGAPARKPRRSRKV